MSYTTIKALWPGERHEDLKELRNSWGSAPHIWESIGKRYISPDFSMFATEKLWPLWDDVDIPKHHRAVLMFTYDRIYVKSADYARMADDIKQFMSDFPVQEGYANHWPEIAETLLSHQEVPAIGLHCTSVSEDPFRGEWDEKSEDYLPFDWSTAFDLYAELDQAQGGASPTSADLAPVRKDGE